MKTIPEDINKIMSYLSKAFSKSMRDPAINSAEDLKEDLIVYYLEHYKKKITKNEWFIRFKNFLVDKYRRVLLEKKLIIKSDDINVDFKK